MHVISSYRGNRPTHPHTHTQPPTDKQTGPIIIHCATASIQCNKSKKIKKEMTKKRRRKNQCNNHKKTTTNTTMTTATTDHYYTLTDGIVLHFL